MRVEPTGTSPILPNSVASAPRTAPGATESPSAAPDPNSFAPSANLAALLSAVRQAPEVRADAVSSAAAKLASGEFDTPQAAAESAKSLLDSGDLSPRE